MRRLHRAGARLPAIALALLVAGAAQAQVDAATMLEQARARARDIEEMKKVLNGPDQNLRLATFGVMVNSGDEAMRAVALDLGLASADRLLQALAFKHAILGLDRLHLILEVDPDASEQAQDQAKRVLQRGNEFVLTMGWRDPERGVFAVGSAYKDKTGYRGEVRGTTVTFSYGNDSGVLELADDDRLEGRVNRGGAQFKASARFR